MGYPHFSTDCIDFHDRIIDWGRKPRENLRCPTHPDSHHSFTHLRTEGTVEYWQCSAPVRSAITGRQRPECGAEFTRATDSSFIPRGIVTLCGSTRFPDEFKLHTRRLTLEGYIVISVGLFGHSELPAEQVVIGHPVKDMLDDLHKRKIDLADMVYVIDVDGYVGDSTRSEIEYAQSRGKAVHYMSKGDLA